MLSRRHSGSNSTLPKRSADQVLHRRACRGSGRCETPASSPNARAHHAVDLLRARQVVAERLFEHARAPAGRSARPRRAARRPTGTGAGWSPGTAPPVSASALSASHCFRRCVVLGLRQVHAPVVQQLGEAGELVVARALRADRPLTKRSLMQGAVVRRRCCVVARDRRGCGRPRGSLPWRKAWNNAGISLRQVRSPVPPNKTRSNDMVPCGRPKAAARVGCAAMIATHDRRDCEVQWGSPRRPHSGRPEALPICRGAEHDAGARC